MGSGTTSDATQLAVLKVDSSHQLDPVLYAPGYRAHFDELRARVRAMPKRRLTVTARGRAGTIYVGGRDVGLSPVTVIVPAGTYRVAGAAGELRPPSVTVDLADGGPGGARSTSRWPRRSGSAAGRRWRCRRATGPARW